MTRDAAARAALGVAVVALAVLLWEMFVFVLLTLAAVPLAIFATIAVWSGTRRTRWVLARVVRGAAAVAAVTASVCAGVYVWAWGRGFEFADGLVDEPVWLTTTLAWSYAVGAVALVALALLVVAVAPAPGRRRPVVTT